MVLGAQREVTKVAALGLIQVSLQSYMYSFSSFVNSMLNPEG